MKKNLLYALLITAAFLISCGDDEPDVNPIVGSWVLDDFVISDTPAGFVLATDANQSNLFGESEYLFTINADGTYFRELERTNGDIEDDGTWELDGNDLDLDVDNENIANALVTSFTVEGDITDRSMTLVTRDTWFAWPQAIWDDPLALDTLDQSEVGAFFNEYGTFVEYTFTMDFDRQ